jgi:hypothetical protein
VTSSSGVRPKFIAYLAVAALGVGGALLMWDRMPDREPFPVSSEAPLPVVSVEEGQAVGDDVEVRGPDGATYGSPWVKWDSGGTIRVSQTVTVPASDGVVEVWPPEVTLVRDGREIAPNPAVDPDSEDRATRLRGGGMAGFAWHFDPDVGGPELEPGDLVTVRVRIPDGLTYDVEGIEVGRPSGRGLSR